MINRKQIEENKKKFNFDWVVKGPTEIYYRITSAKLYSRNKDGQPYKNGSFIILNGKFQESNTDGYAHLFISEQNLIQHPVLHKLIEQGKERADLNEYMKNKEITLVGSIYNQKYEDKDGDMRDSLQFKKDYSNIQIYTPTPKNPQNKDGTIDWESE